jgi:hypothetical protein
MACKSRSKDEILVGSALAVFSLDNKFSVYTWKIMESDDSEVKVLLSNCLLCVDTHVRFIKEKSTGRISKCLPESPQSHIKHQNRVSIPKSVPRKPVMSIQPS